MADQDEQFPNNPVELRARRDGDSVVVSLTRATAAVQAVELEQEGWTVEIVEVQTQP